MKKRLLLINVFLCSFSTISLAKNVISLNEKNGEKTSALKQNQRIFEMDGASDGELLNYPLCGEINNTIYQDNNYAPYYFKSLTSNYGYNSYNSCGYIATAMLLSFWDTYWDDNIIEEKYDVNAELMVNHSSLNDDDYLESPGVAKEPQYIYDADINSYHDYIMDYSDEYFQFLLLEMGSNLFGSDFSPDGNYYMDRSWYETLLSNYLYNYRGYSTNDVEIIVASNSNARTQAINLIKQGIPVKLSLSNYYGGHAVIGYDYDEQRREIYCHAGLGSELTHVTIDQIGYSSIVHMCAIKFNNSHSHSNNFEYHRNGETIYHCPCETVVPYDIQEVDYYLDIFPTYKWHCLSEERWYRDIEGHIRFEILNQNMVPVYSSGAIYNNEFRLNKFAAEKLMSASNNNNYFIRVSTFSTNDASFNTRYYYFRTVYKPTTFFYNANKYLSISSLSKSGASWNVTIRNNTIYKLNAQYNSKMCFENDAKNWTGLNNIKNVSIMPLDTITVSISENFFATSITMSYQMYNQRYITYAKNLNANGSFSPYTNIKNL